MDAPSERVCRSALATLIAEPELVDAAAVRSAQLHAARCPRCSGALDDGDPDAVLDSLSRHRPSRHGGLRVALAAAAIIQAGLALPWLVGANPVATWDHAAEAHLTRDGALGLVLAAAGILAAWQPRYARPLVGVGLAVLALHVVAGVVDESHLHVRLAFELVHILAFLITALVVAVGFLPRLRPVEREPVRRRVAR